MFLMNRKIIILLILLVGLNSGCYNIRQKFIRKKKEKEELPVYVDFKDYPQAPSRQAYIDYYLFVRGWLGELTSALNKGLSYKRQKRAINESVMNLEQIISFYNLEGKNKIYPFYEELLEIRKDIQRCPNMSDTKKNSLIRQIERFKRNFEREFNYSDAEKWMS